MLRLAAALLSLGFGAAAWADNVTFPGFVDGSETVTLKLVAPDAPVTETVNAGAFSTVLNGGPSFASYCVDVYQTISFGSPYGDYVPVGGSHVFDNSTAYADLSKLFGIAGGLVDNAVTSAAFQIAVWEIAYETDGVYDLSSGTATFTGGTADSSGSLKLATTWLGELAGAGAGPKIGVLDSATHQDVVYAPIPEPSTVALMVFGLLGLATVARRRGATFGPRA
jgi:hypothetical protein